VNADPGNNVFSPTYYSQLAGGQEMALMFIVSSGMNRTNALNNAAEIDTEPAHIFHGTFSADDHCSVFLNLCYQI
jgi:hypothetical protein